MSLDPGLTAENVQLAVFLYACMFVGLLSAVLLGCELRKGYCLWRARADVRRSVNDHIDV